MKSEVFFFITTIAVILVTVLLLVLIVYLIKIFKDIKYISTKAKTETDSLAADIAGLRQNIKEQGFKFGFIKSIFKNIFSKKKK